MTAWLARDVSEGGVWQALGSTTMTIKNFIAMFVELNYEYRQIGSYLLLINVVMS